MHFKYKFFRKLFSVLITAICVSIGNLYAQPLYRITKYTQQEGLASSIISRIGKDSTGFIWLASENGLTRFDGYTFKTYRHTINDSTSISSSDVNSMWVDTERNILFRTGNSISKFNPERETFKSLISFNGSSLTSFVFPGNAGFWVLADRSLVFIDASTEKINSYSLPESFEISRLTEALCFNNSVFLKSSRSLYVFDIPTKEFRIIPIQYPDSTLENFRRQPVNFFLRNDHTIGFFSIDGYFFYNPIRNSFIQYAKSSILSDYLAGYTGRLIIRNSYQVITTSNGKILCLNLNSGQENTIDLTDESDPAVSEVIPFSVFPGSNGLALVSTSNNGIFSFDPVTLKLEHLLDGKKNGQFGLPLDIEHLYQDKNILWFTSPGIGLFKAELYNPVFSSFRPDENIQGHNTWSLNVRTIAEMENKNILIGSLNGLFLFNRITNKFSVVPSPEDSKPMLENERISKICTDSSGVIWIATWSGNGVYALDYKNKKTIKIEPRNPLSDFSDYSIRSMLIDSRGTLWIGTSRDMIYRIRLKDIDWRNPLAAKFEEISRKKTRYSLLHFNIVFAIEETRNGEILIGSQEGFYTYSYTNNTYIRYVNNPSDIKSLGGNNVRCIYEDHNGIIWIGTNGGGLNRFDPNTHQFTSFNIEEGLPDNAVFSICADKNNLLWIGTNKGLCNFNTVTKSFRSFTPEDGIQNFEFNTNSALRTKDNYMVFGGINGFNLFYPDSFINLKNNFPIVVTGIKIFDKPVHLPKSNSFSNDKVLELAYNENYISFQFALLSYFRNQENQYAYRLEGLDDEWVFCGDRRFVSYANLSPGKYIFRVKAANYSGIWNENGTRLIINIGTAWWNTWYFRAFILAGCFGMVYLFYLYRLRQANKLQLIRNRIARDLHDEVGSNLSSISIFSEVANAKAGQSADEIRPLLRKITSYTQTSMEAIADIVWVINSSNDRFEDILVRMRLLAAESFENLDCKLNLQLDESLNRHKIGMENRKNIYLIYKEALNNIVKYSNCRHVEICISPSSQAVELKISDDGEGFDMDMVKRGNGLNNMQKRAEALKGKLQISSAPGLGTSLLLTFPI